MFETLIENETFENLEEMDNILEEHLYTKLAQEGKENLNSPMSI